MHKFITPLLVLFVSINAFSQDEYFKLPNAKTQKPCLIVNKKIIGNDNLIKGLVTTEREVKEKVNGIWVLKGKGNRKENDYYNLTDYGLVFLDLKESPESKTQSEFKEFFGLDKKAKIYIDGYLLESKKYRIATIGITEIEIVEPDNANGLKSWALNIWTLPKNERYRIEPN